MHWGQCGAGGLCTHRETRDHLLAALGFDWTHWAHSDMGDSTLSQVRFWLQSPCVYKQHLLPTPVNVAIFIRLESLFEARGAFLFRRVELTLVDACARDAASQASPTLIHLLRRQLSEFQNRWLAAHNMAHNDRGPSGAVSVSNHSAVDDSRGSTALWFETLTAPGGSQAILRQVLRRWGLRPTPRSTTLHALVHRSRADEANHTRAVGACTALVRDLAADDEAEHRAPPRPDACLASCRGLSCGFLRSAVRCSELVALPFACGLCAPCCSDGSEDEPSGLVWDCSARSTLLGKHERCSLFRADRQQCNSARYRSVPCIYNQSSGECSKGRLQQRCGVS